MPGVVYLVVRRFSLLPLLALLAALSAAPASAEVNRAPVGTFTNPIFLLSPPGDTARLFVVERAGRVRISQGGATLPTPFLDISAGVSTAGEGGLLSLAFPPDYATSGRFYLYFTPRADTIRIAEGRRDPSDPNRAVSTLRRVIDVPHPTNLNHYGGQLQFDRAGRLYVFTGDGGGGGDPEGNARDLTSTLGKVLRIDPRGAGDGDYSVPADNPFAGQAGRRREIWSYGLRNPFRASFDRVTGDLTIGDVGQAAYEEIDFHGRTSGAGRGADFGWNACEGTFAYPVSGAPCPLTRAPYVSPVHQYPNPSSACAAVTGGYVVRDPSLEELAGKYLYADYCSGEVRRLNTPAGGGDALVFAADPFQVASFGEDACGRIYVSELASGQVSRLEDGSSACVNALALPPAPPNMLGPVAPPQTNLGPVAPPKAPGSGIDLRPPLLGLRTGARQRPLRNRGVIARIRCDERCSYRVSGRLSLRRAGRKIALRQRTGSLPADTTERLRLRLSSHSARALRRALRRGRLVRARVEVRARDHAGNLAKGSRLLRLKR
ncbi:MAG: PQQ-dependent sugar dehydrogenase [Actinomycetota bacterium]|nr:PQQ-dependent sugar dehydrogenase [Actinomycetota bacterium]